MHYKLDPKVIDASSVPSFNSLPIHHNIASFNSLPIHHNIDPQLIDAYIASTTCVARLQRASVRGRLLNVHVFEIHRLVARWLSYSPAPTSTPSRTLWCSRGVACLAQRMRPRLRPTRRKMADAMVHKADPLRRGGTIPNCTPRALTRGGKNFSMLDIGPTSGVFSPTDAP